MIEQLNKLKPQVLYCLSGITIALIACICLIILKSQHFSYVRGDTTIEVKSAAAKKVINNDRYNERQLEERIKQLERAIANSNTPIEVVDAVEQLKPTAKAKIESSEELQEIVHKISHLQ